MTDEPPLCGICEEVPAILDGLAPLKMPDWDEAVPYPVPLCRACAEGIIYTLMHVWMAVRRRTDPEKERLCNQQLVKRKCSRCGKFRYTHDPYAYEWPEPIDGGRLAKVLVEEEPELGGWLGLLEEDDG